MLSQPAGRVVGFARTLMRQGPCAIVARSLQWAPHSLSRACCYFVALGCPALLSSACVIGPPDDLKELPQIPPRVYMESVLPTPFAYVETRSTDAAPSFSVEFVSEDRNEQVKGNLYLNLDAKGEQRIGTAVVGPGTIDMERPPITIYWENYREIAGGCYAITMTLAHRDNYDDATLENKPLDRTKTAYVTWWVAHDIAVSDLTFDSCPPPSPQPPPDL